MILVADYQPATNPEPKVYREVRKATQWRVEMHLERNDGSIDRRTMRVMDKMRIGEVHLLAIDEMRAMTGDDDTFADCGFALWADV